MGETTRFWYNFLLYPVNRKHIFLHRSSIRSRCALLYIHVKCGSQLSADCQIIMKKKTH